MILYKLHLQPHVACLEQAPYQVTVRLLLVSSDVFGDNIFSELVSNQQTHSINLVFITGNLLSRQLYNVDVLLCNSAGCSISSELSPFSEW